VEVRSAALFLNAQAQFRSQLPADYSAFPQQIFLLRKLRKCAKRNKLRTRPPLNYLLSPSVCRMDRITIYTARKLVLVIFQLSHYGMMIFIVLSIRLLLSHISRKFSPHFMPAHQYTVTDIGRQSHRPVIFLYVNKLLLPLIAFAYAYICTS
jgi:hypothetical protein